MMKSSISFGFSSSLFLFFFIVASIVVYSEADSECLYKVVIITGPVTEAGTNSSIKVTIGNFDGEWVEMPDLMKWSTMSSGHDHFETGNRDIFEVEAPCINIPLCKINVTSDGSGQNPGWNLDSVSVFIYLLAPERIPMNMTVFGFNQWLAIDEPPNKLTASRDVCEPSDGDQNTSSPCLPPLGPTPCA